MMPTPNCTTEETCIIEANNQVKSMLHRRADTSETILLVDNKCCRKESTRHLGVTSLHRSEDKGNSLTLGRCPYPYDAWIPL